ncbi:MAG TPA: hypothetical protein VJ579_01225 [Candidatus Paceibacterota bacterium]|nr:hypothetical protein [Candidatus Paceibacterota bacterium]
MHSTERNIFRIGVPLIAFLLVCTFSVSAREVAVSNRTFVSGMTAPFSSSQTINFTVHGGEVLGASTPMRVYLSVDGLYEGGGTLVLRLDGDAATDQTYVLPNTASPLPLALVFGDKTGKLAAATAGDYLHQVTFIPSGVTLSGTSVHVTNSYTREIGNNCPDGAPQTEKMKTVEFFIAQAPSISGVTTFPISYAINDNITGISGPVTSAYIEMVGLYVGGGEVAAYFNDRNIDGMTHTLIATSEPTQFDFLSANVRNVFQRGSAGNYSQNITVDPGAVALLNVSIKLVLTYRFHPAQSNCGGFPPTGTAESVVLDTRAPKGVLYNSFTWRGQLGGAGNDKGRVRFQMATAPCVNGATNFPVCTVGAWSYIGGPSCSSGDWFTTMGPDIPFDLFRSGCSALLDGKQYYRYKVQLCADDCLVAGPTTPSVDEIFLSWSP